MPTEVPTRITLDQSEYERLRRIEEKARAFTLVYWARVEGDHVSIFTQTGLEPGKRLVALQAALAAEPAP